MPGLNISAYADAPVALEKGAKQVRFFVPWELRARQQAPYKGATSKYLRFRVR